MHAIALHPLTRDRAGYLGSLVIDGDRVWAVGGTNNQPTILYSQDRGHSFVKWATPEGMPGLRDLHVEGDRVWVVGEWGGVATTDDHGATWNVTKPARLECLYSVMRGADRKLWILGDNGLVLRSRTIKNPAKFDPVENRSTARMLYMFVDGGETWLLDSAGVMQRDRGRQFDKVPLKAMRTTRPLCALVRTPRKTLLLLGDGGLILRSTNDAKSWKKISVDSRNDLEKLVITRYGIFVVGARGSLLVSHDDGQSFQGLDTGVDAHLWSLAEIDGELLIGGEAGQIWRIGKAALADLLCKAYATTDKVLSDLAAHLRDGEDGAELVLEDALKERELL